MKDAVQFAVRIPRDLLKRIDAEAIRLAKEMPGVTMNRTVVIRVLITRGLDAVRPK